MVDAAELRAVALFGSLDDQELESLSSCAELVEVPSEGVDLTRQGDFGHAVFAVVGGTADVTVDGSPGASWAGATSSARSPSSRPVGARRR